MIHWLLKHLQPVRISGHFSSGPIFGHCLREALRHSGDFAVRDVSPALYVTLKVFQAQKKTPDVLYLCSKKKMY
jgi:hypothetical protein